MSKSLQVKNGFTLIELMVIVSIIGIMASTAVPNYIGWVVSKKITSATNLIEQLKGNVDQFYQQK